MSHAYSRSIAAAAFATAILSAFAWAAPDSRRDTSGSRPLEIDHLMIHVSPGAPERTALERAGFRIAHDVNRHVGQGTASIMVELDNGFLELSWREETVSVAPGLEKVARRFEHQGQWRTSGWSPLTIGLRRAADAPDSLPFPTLSVHAEWMAPGDHLEILSPGDTLGPRFAVVPRTMAADGRPESDSERQRLSQPESFVHANGARRITAVRILAPKRGLTAATRLAAKYSPVTFSTAQDWLLEVTFDGGKRHSAIDLRPDLPMIVRL